MRCKDVERHLVENPAKLSEDIREHLAGCPRCARLREDLALLRTRIQSLPRPVPPQSLRERTRGRCLALLSAHREAEPGFRRAAGTPIPAPIWIALAALIVLTGLVMLPGLGELFNRSGSKLSAAVLALLLQNAGMLVLAPILLRAGRRPRARVNGYALDRRTT
jgi:hypothetical protein